MSVENHIGLLGKGDDLSVGTASPVGFLFELAPDSEIWGRYGNALPVKELLGDVEEIKLRAARLARRMLESEPEFEGIRHLTVFEELVIRELQRFLHVVNLHEALISRGFGSCGFSQKSRVSIALERLAKATQSGLKVCYRERLKSQGGGRISRVLDRLRSAGFSRRSWAKELNQAIVHIDPYAVRNWIRPKPRITKHEIIFYSTAETFTNIGLLYEPYFDGSLQFYVESPVTGGRPLRARKRRFLHVHRFSRPETLPLGKDIRRVSARIEQHILGVKLQADETLLRRLLLEGDFFSTFRSRLLPGGIYMSRLWRSIIEDVEPAALVTGNPVFEAYALIPAREKGVPTVLLQHGILGDFCQFVDPPVDHYIVRGEFWRDFLSKPARAKAQVLNPPSPTSDNFLTSEVGTTLVFFTTPYDLQEIWHEADLHEILCALLDAAQDLSLRLIIRVHPLEDINYYRHRVERLAHGLHQAPDVEYSQGTDLKDILKQARVAVMFSSTVFMQCLECQIPIVSFDWHEFSYKKHIEPENVFHFAARLTDLRHLIAKLTNNPAQPPRGNLVKTFLAETAPKTVRNSLRDIVSGQLQQIAGRK